MSTKLTASLFSLPSPRTLQQYTLYSLTPSSQAFKFLLYTLQPWLSFHKLPHISSLQPLYPSFSLPLCEPMAKMKPLGYGETSLWNNFGCRQLYNRAIMSPHFGKQSKSNVCYSDKVSNQWFACMAAMRENETEIKSKQLRSVFYSYFHGDAGTARCRDNLEAGDFSFAFCYCCLDSLVAQYWEIKLKKSYCCLTWLSLLLYRRELKNWSRTNADLVCWEKEMPRARYIK